MVTSVHLSLLLVLLLVTPGVAADGNGIAAESPVEVSGGSRVLLPAGGFFLGLKPGPVGGQVHAPAATLHYLHDRYECPEATGTPAGCPQREAGEFHGDRETFHVTELRLEVLGEVRNDFFLALELHDSGTARLTQGPDGLVLLHAPNEGSGGTTTREDWVSYHFAYHSGSTDYLAEAPGGALEATGDLAIAFQGVDVRVTGVTGNGTPIDRIFRTGLGEDRENGLVTRTHSLLHVDAASANVSMDVGGPLLAAGALQVFAGDVVHLTNAHGNHPGPGGGPLTGQNTRLEGPLQLTPVGHETGLDGRPRIRVLTEPVPLADGSRGPLPAVVLAVATTLLCALLFVRVHAAPQGFRRILASLYTRISRGRALEHPAREKLLEAIRANPGIDQKGAAEQAGLGRGSAAHHLRVLERHGIIATRRVGRHRRLFVAGDMPRQLRDAEALLRNATAARVAHRIREEAGISQVDLARRLDLSPSLVTWHVRRLEDADLVKRVKTGHRVRYFPGPAWDALPDRVP